MIASENDGACSAVVTKQGFSGVKYIKVDFELEASCENSSGNVEFTLHYDSEDDGSHHTVDLRESWSNSGSKTIRISRETQLETAQFKPTDVSYLPIQCVCLESAQGDP